MGAAHDIRKRGGGRSERGGRRFGAASRRFAVGGGGGGGGYGVGDGARNRRGERRGRRVGGDRGAGLVPLTRPGEEGRRGRYKRGAREVPPPYAPQRFQSRHHK